VTTSEKKNQNSKDTFWIIDLDRAIRNEESLSMIKDYDKNSKQIKIIAASLKMKINTAYKNSKIEVVIWKI